MGRSIYLALAAFVFAPSLSMAGPASARAPAATKGSMPRILFRMPIDGGEIEAVAASPSGREATARASGPDASSSSDVTASPYRSPPPSLDAIADPDTTYLWFQHGFDRASDGACFTRGWTGQDRSTLVFAHVDTKHLINDAYITMGTKALWFGIDANSHPQEVALWYYPEGYGNNWSQRLTSNAAFTNGDFKLTFDGHVALQISGGLQAGLTNKWVAVQAESIGGKWAMLKARWVAPSGTTIETRLGLRGYDSFKCTVTTHPDSQGGFVYATPTRFRIVVQTTAGGSDEDGTAGSSPTPDGAAVIDNIRLQDLGGGADPIPLHDFEDGTTGPWTLSARNGGSSGTLNVIRDVAPPNANVTLAKGFDPNDPSCLWQFTNSSGYVGAGTFVYLTSPWIAREPTADTTLTWLANVKWGPGGRSPNFLGRFIFPLMRGKNAGDSYARRLFARSSFIYFNLGESDPEMIASDLSFRYPLDLGNRVGSVLCDSIQFTFVSVDYLERFNVNPATRAPTKLPWFDDMRLVQYHADSDYDGVRDTRDACSAECAAGQDADGDGCVDTTATLRHVESWSGTAQPITFRLSQDGDPAITDGSDLQALRDGFAAWDNVAGSNLEVVEEAVTAMKNASGTDGINLLTFQDDYAFPGNVLAVTPTVSFTKRAAFDDRMRLPGEILDADIMFNPNATFRTATAGPPTGSFDLKSVATHEIGHLLGLSHSGAADATMFPVLQSGTLAASLESDDAAAIAAAYPGVTLLTNYGRITGRLTRGSNGAAVPGALVMAVQLSGGNPSDTTASDYTDENGDYALFRLPAGDYGVRVVPLDGGVPALVPGAINARVEAIAQTNFKPEWYGGPESNNDDPDVRQTLVVTAGGALTANVITNIDITPPTVVTVSPADTTTGQRIDTPILITFSESVASSTIGAAFKLHTAGGSGTLGGRGQLLAPGLSFVFIPDDPLAFSTNYEIVITTALKDVESNALADTFKSTFRTQSQPPVSIGDLSPREAPIGALVTLNGSGYDASVPNRVYFSTSGGFAGYVLGTLVAPTSMVVEVPADAVSGPVKVEVGGIESNLFSFDLLTSAVEAPSPNGDAVSVGFAPSDVVLSPDGKTAFAVGGGGFARINLDPLRPSYRLAVPTALGACKHIALLPSGLRAYVTRPGSGKVVEVDTDPQSGNFGQPADSISVPGTPDAIVLSPSGQRAYVTDQDAGVVYELDVDATSSLYRHRLRDISVPGALLAGAITIDPRRERLVLTTKNLGLISVDLDSTTLVTTLSSQAASTGVAVTPGGGRVLACAPSPDAGTILFSDPLGNAPGSLEVGGDARDVAINPDGATAFMVNAQLGRLQVVDVTQASPRLVANVATGGTPVAVAVSGGGTQVAAANFAGQSISFYNVVSTATPVRITPPVALPGDRVAIAVSGGALPPGTVVETGATSAPAVHVVATGAAFQVPALAATSTTATLITSGVRSLGLPFEVVDPIVGLDPRATGLALDPVDVDCGAGPTDGALRLLRVAPDGKLIAVSREGPSCARVDVYQAIPEAGTALGGRLVNGASFTGSTVFRDLAFTPDGKRLWVASDAAGLFELNVDAQSGGFGSVLPFGAATVGTARALASDPMGRYMLVGTEVTPGTHQLQLWAPGRTLSGAVGVPGAVRSLAVTPDGHYAIAGGEGRAHLVDLAAPALLGSTLLHTIVPPDAVTSIAVTTNGRHAVGLFPDNRIGIWNVDPAAGTVGSEIYFGQQLVAGAISQLVPAPDGANILAGCANCNTLTRFSPGPSPGSSSATLGQPARALARSADGRTLWAADWNDGTLAGAVTAFTLSPGSTFALVSGAGQSAAIGQTLPLPVRVHLLDDATGHDVSGALVRFTLASAAHGALDGGATQVIKPTDATGETEVTWTMPGVGANVSLTVTALGIAGAALTVTAEATIDENLALPTAIEFGPAAGATGINAGSELFVRFNQPIDSTSVDSGAVIIVNHALAGSTVHFQDQGRSLFLKPFVPLAYGAACTVVVHSPLRDMQGQAIPAEVRSAFTVQLPPTLAVQSLSPPSAPAGATVTINGDGFSPIPSANTVSFNGVVSPVTSSSAASLVTTVPASATSGPLTVSVGASTSAPVPFIVLAAHPTPLSIRVDSDARQGIEAIAVTPDGARAYITLPSANSVLVFDLNGRRVIKTIPVGLKPQDVAIEPDGRYAYVVNTGSDNVSVIDIDPGSPTYHRTLPAPVHPIKVGDRPMSVVVSAFGPTILVINEGSATVSIIDADPDAGSFDRVTSSVSLGSRGKDITITPDGTRAYIATDEGIVVVDVASRAVTSTIKTGSAGKDVTISPDGTVLFALGDNGVLHIIDIAPGSQTYNRVVRSQPVGSGGHDVTVSPDGTLLYLTLGDLNAVQAFKIIRGTGGGAGSGVAPGEPATLELLQTVPVGSGPTGIAFLPNGSEALVVNQASGTVSVLRNDSLLAVPDQPAVVLPRLGVHPTPSLGTAAVRFSLTRRTEVEIEIFDLQGRLVKRLVHGVLEAGPHTVSWNGDHRAGGRVGAGIYFARMRAEGRVLHARVVWLR